MTKHIALNLVLVVLAFVGLAAYEYVAPVAVEVYQDVRRVKGMEDKLDRGLAMFDRIEKKLDKLHLFKQDKNGWLVPMTEGDFQALQAQPQKEPR